MLGVRQYIRNSNIKLKIWITKNIKVKIIETKGSSGNDFEK